MIVQFNNNIPIYMQLVDDIKKNIISGKLKSGEKICSVRDFANMYKVNPNTMQKALQELENCGLIYTQRTNGKFVTEKQELIIKLRKEFANNLASEYINNMKGIGIQETEAINLLKGGDIK